MRRWAERAGRRFPPGTIIALATYNTASLSGDVDVPLGTSLSVSSSPTTINSLRFSNTGGGSGASSVVIGSGNQLIISSGGILETALVAGNAVNIDTGSPGSLTSGNGTDLIVIQNNTTAGGAMTIGSTITDNVTSVALTKSGAGTLILTNSSNSYSGGTYLNAGVVKVAAAGR